MRGGGRVGDLAHCALEGRGVTLDALGAACAAGCSTMPNPRPNTLFASACRVGLVALVSMAAQACAVADPPAPSATSIWFAALTGDGCTATSNGKKQIPADVDTLVAQWTANLANGDKKTGTARIAGAKVGAGAWEIKGIPVTGQLDLDVFGCSKDKKLVYAGRNNGVQVQEGASPQPVRIFLAPADKLACTGSPFGSPKLSVARALAGTAALTNGDAVVVGGLGTWDKLAGSGNGIDAVDYYDARQGHFVAGPKLSSARILPHVHAISQDGKQPQLLVVGGAVSVKRYSANSPFVLDILVPEKLDGAAPSIKAELLDLTAGKASTKGLDPTKVDVGVGANILSSAIRLGTAILYVGGVSETGQIMDKATRLGNPEEILTGGTGKSDSVKLNAARVRPALLSFADDTAVIWGGAVLANGKAAAADAMGELLEAGTPVSVKLKVTGPASLVDDPNLSTVAPVVVPVSRTADVLTFVVAGGVPIESAQTAVAAPSYLVTVTRSTQTAELRPVTVGGDKLRAGLFGIGLGLDGRRLLMGGGLVAMSATADVQPLCEKADPNTADCVIDSAWVVKVPATLAPGDSPVALELVTKLGLGGSRLGVAVAPTPLGALLAGGLASTRTGDTAAVIDDVGQVLTVTPPAADAAIICK